MQSVASRPTMGRREDADRTCCNCWHIKHGTLALGLLELCGVLLILSGILNQLAWKSNLNTSCEQNNLQPKDFRHYVDCSWRQFAHYGWALVSDYVLALLLCLICLCILLLFLGIMKKSPLLLLPHLIVQGICLVFSLIYFVVQAFGYFYGDLYTRKFRFRLQSFLERMWIASLMLILAAFQYYLLFTVIKCCRYLQSLRNAQLRRLRQYEECSRRVRDAKQNGLWRSTSWGGGFQEYKGQYEETNQWQKKREKPAVHVQWNLQGNMEKSFSVNEESLRDLNDNAAKEKEKLKKEEKKVPPKEVVVKPLPSTVPKPTERTVLKPTERTVLKPTDRNVDLERGREVKLELGTPCQVAPRNKSSTTTTANTPTNASPRRASETSASDRRLSPRKEGHDGGSESDGGRLERQRHHSNGREHHRRHHHKRREDSTASNTSVGRCAAKQTMVSSTTSSGTVTSTIASSGTVLSSDTSEVPVTGTAPSVKKPSSRGAPPSPPPGSVTSNGSTVSSVPFVKKISISSSGGGHSCSPPLHNHIP